MHESLQISDMDMNMFGLNAAQLESAGARWTAQEILQQPEVWSEIQAQIAGQSAPLAGFIDPWLMDPSSRIILTGAGTSAHIGGCVAPALTRALHRRIEAIPTTDLVASPESYLSAASPTLLVSFARSGNSPESVAALDIADALLPRCAHLVLTCDAQGQLCQRAKDSGNAYVIVLPERSNDRSFAMTSSFTGMLYAAALALRALPGRTDLQAMAQRLIPDQIPLLQALVAEQFKRVVFLGAKEFQGLATEAALKTLEMTDGAIVAIADSPLGVRHGPKTILNRDTVVVIYVSNDEHTRQYDLDLVNELRRDGVARRVLALSGRPWTPAHPDNIAVEEGSAVPPGVDLELCLPFAMFSQSLAMLCALSLGVHPDNPNTAGTVSRVVKGVTIHPWRGTV
jgi:tagatose-6-phosphate ketose/aldose isomerase